jgi:hypothetical protein
MQLIPISPNNKNKDSFDANVNETKKENEKIIL